MSESTAKIFAALKSEIEREAEARAEARVEARLTAKFNAEMAAQLQGVRSQLAACKAQLKEHEEVKAKYGRLAKRIRMLIGDVDTDEQFTHVVEGGKVECEVSMPVVSRMYTGIAEPILTTAISVKFRSTEGIDHLNQRLMDKGGKEPDFEFPKRNRAIHVPRVLGVPRTLSSPCDFCNKAFGTDELAVIPYWSGAYCLKGHRYHVVCSAYLMSAIRRKSASPACLECSLLAKQ